MIIETFSVHETINIGKMIGEEAHKGDVFCLTGDLGCGKTAFSKGFALGMKIKEEITSPTFTIVNKYINELEREFFHFDVYRIEDINEMDNIGYEEYFYGNGTCLIEWADMIKEIIPDNAIWITIEKDLSKGLDYRKIKINEEN